MHESRDRQRIVDDNSRFRFHRLYRFPVVATPIVDIPHDADVVVRFVCAADKPRNHGFTLHGHAWQEWPHRGAWGTSALAPVAPAVVAAGASTVTRRGLQEWVSESRRRLPRRQQGAAPVRPRRV